MDVTYKLDIKHIFISAFAVALDQMRIDASDLVFLFPLYSVFGYNVMLEKSLSCITILFHMVCLYPFSFLWKTLEIFFLFAFFIDTTHMTCCYNIIHPCHVCNNAFSYAFCFYYLEAYFCLFVYNQRLITVTV